MAPGALMRLYHNRAIDLKQVLYEAFEGKHYLHDIHDLPSLSLLSPVSLFDLESRFFAPPHKCWRPARAGTVKAGRRSALALRSIAPARLLLGIGKGNQWSLRLRCDGYQS
jgi:hypothetical protein